MPSIDVIFEEALSDAVADQVAELLALYADRRDPASGETDIDAINELPLRHKLQEILEILWPMIDHYASTGEHIDLAFLLPYPDMELQTDIIESHLEHLASRNQATPELLEQFAAGVRNRMALAQGDPKVMEQLNALLRLQQAIAHTEKSIAEQVKLSEAYRSYDTLN